MATLLATLAAASLAASSPVEVSPIEFDLEETLPQPSSEAILSAPIEVPTMVEPPEWVNEEHRLALEEWEADRKFRKQVRNREIAYQVLHAMDVATTIYCLEKVEGCYEMNPILGKNPSTEKLILLGIAGGIGHYLITKKLASKRSKWTDEWQKGTIIFTGFLVGNNVGVILGW